WWAGNSRPESRIWAGAKMPRWVRGRDSQEWTIPPLQARQRKSAPPRLFAQWSSQEKYVNKESEHWQWGQASGALKRCQGFRQENDAQHHDRRKADECEQVPFEGHPPQRQLAQ